MAKKDRRAQQQPTPAADTEAMLQAAGLPPDQQISEVFRFIRTDLTSETGMAWLPPESETRPPMLWSGFLKGLPRRPCASDSGRLKITWSSVLVPEPLPLAILQGLQRYLQTRIRDVLGYGDRPPLRGIWNLPEPAQLSMGAQPGGGFTWIYSHWRDPGAEDAPVPGIVLAVAQLVAEHADRIRLCKLSDCGVIFLANRHQEFCTTEHGQRARDQKKKER